MAIAHPEFQARHLSNSVNIPERLCLGIVISCYILFVLVLGLNRSYLGYGVETDFIGGFLPDALRLLDGEPLRSTYHPPLYSLIIAAVGGFIGDWLVTGVLVSVVAGVAALMISYSLFLRLGGPPAAWGAVFGLLGSGVFVSISAQASSDALFLALFLGSCLLAVEALRSGSSELWFRCGLAAGLGLLTRTNGLTLVLFALAPLLARSGTRRRASACLAVAGGLAIPVVAVLSYGAATGSNVFPSGTLDNLAASYFSDSMGGDRLGDVAGRFDSIIDVVLQDPVLIVKKYIFDLYRLAGSDFRDLIETPLYFLFLPGLFFFFGERRDRALLIVVGMMIIQVLLVNFKQPFEARNYLFAVPLIGAGVGVLSVRIVRAGRELGVWRTFAASIVMMIALSTGAAFAKAYVQLRGLVSELEDAVPAIRHEVDDRATIVARKRHVAFYVGAEPVIVPTSATVEMLGDFLQPLAEERPVYLFVGQVERQFRPQLAALQTPDEAPVWLEPIAQSNRGGGWILYRYHPQLTEE